LSETRFDAGLEVGHFNLLSPFARQNPKVSDDFAVAGHGDLASGMFQQDPIPLRADFPNGNTFHVTQPAIRDDGWQSFESLYSTNNPHFKSLFPT
jgi:hypothetical protein